MVLFTGDTHGETIKVVSAIRRHKLTSADVVVILGDAGMNYYGNDQGDSWRKRKLNREGVPILCIHGNHERRPATIDTYKVIEWHGGKVYMEDEFPNLLFAMDGEVYDLEEQKAIAIGGAYSVDKYYRLARGLHWFPDEQPDEATKADVLARLQKVYGVGNVIDRIDVGGVVAPPNWSQHVGRPSRAPSSSATAWTG